MATNILFHWIPFNSVKQVYRFSWQLFFCVPLQPVHSNSVISLATMKWAKIAHFKALKLIFMWIKHGKKLIREPAIIGFDHGLPCRVKNMARGTQYTKIGFCRYWGLGFCLLSPTGHVFHTARETMIQSIVAWSPAPHNRDVTIRKQNKYGTILMREICLLIVIYGLIIPCEK